MSAKFNKLTKCFVRGYITVLHLRLMSKNENVTHFVVNLLSFHVYTKSHAFVRIASTIHRECGVQCVHPTRRQPQIRNSIERVNCKPDIAKR